MLSVNYLSNFLSDKQVAINRDFYNKINEFERIEIIKIENNIERDIKESNKLNLPESFNMLFNKSIINFYYDNKKYKNRSSIFSFLNSLFLIGDEFFNLNDDNEKTNIIKDFIKNIDNDLFQKELYHKFDYHKNLNFNKADIQEVIKNAYQFKTCDKFSLLKQYISDYLGINIYIFNVNNQLIDFDKSEYYLTKYYNNINKYLPNFMFFYDNGVYKPILLKLETSSIIKYSINKDIIDNIWNYFKIVDIVTDKIKDTNTVNEANIKIIVEKNENNKFNIEILKKLKIEELKNLCNENAINLQKKSDKTLKMINKLKIELIADLLKI